MVLPIADVCTISWEYYVSLIFVKEIEVLDCLHSFALFPHGVLRPGVAKQKYKTIISKFERIQSL
jgi:hypothetical protein